MDKQKPNLTGVPETMLWTLYNRAAEAIRPDGIINDQKAIELYELIEYDYQRNFGKVDLSHPVRSVFFDKEVSKFINKFPQCVVVNLGEGLETQRFRVPNKNVEWYCVDLPDAIKIREKFISPDERHKHVAMSATDSQWMQLIPRDTPVIITAQGLLMYFKEEEVVALLNALFDRFTTCIFVFDTIPQWLSKKSMSKQGWKRTSHYTTPKMPWGINRREVMTTFTQWLGDKVKVEDMGYPAYPRGIYGFIAPMMAKSKRLGTIFPTIVRLSSKSVD